MMWILGALAVGIIACGTFLASGKFGQMPEQVDDHPVPRLPQGDFTPADITKLRFATTMRGYAAHEVDDLLDRVADTLQGSGLARPIAPADLRSASFHVVARGYHMGQVDEVLDRLTWQLSEHKAVATPAPPDRPSVTPDDPTTTPDAE